MSGTQRVIIEGDVVRYEETYVQRQVGLGAFIETLKQDRDVSLPRLPRNTRFFTQKGNQIWIVIELEPGLRFLKTESHQVGLRLSMPWQYFAFSFIAGGGYPTINWSFADYRLFWSKTRIKSLTERVIPASLPNVYRNDGKICFGATAPESTLELAERIDTLVNEFFSPASLFNRDLGWNIPPSYESFRSWAMASRNDPLICLKWDNIWGNNYCRYGHPISEYMTLPEGYDREEKIVTWMAAINSNRTPRIDSSDPVLAGLDEEECQCDECIAERTANAPTVAEEITRAQEELENIEALPHADLEEDEEEEEEPEEEDFDNEEPEEEFEPVPQWDENGNPL